MPKSNTLSAFLIALIITIIIAIAAILIAIIGSTTGSSAGSIGVYAGGLSQRFISMMMVGLPLIFIALFLILRKARG